MRPRHPVQPKRSAIGHYLCCLAFTGLQACQPSGPEAPFERYLGKLGVALPTVVPGIRPGAALVPPLAAKLQLQIPASTIVKLDILQLSGCAVQSNIGKRQTSIGQFAKSSQRLFLDLEYLRLAPACISQLRSRNNVALADILEAAWHETQAQLPTLIFNATLGSDEYRAFWLAEPVPGDYPRSSARAATIALDAVNRQARRWLSGDYRAHNHTHNREFELLLSDVAGGDGGTRLKHWSRQIDRLAAADLMVKQALASGAVCKEHNPDLEGRKRIDTVQNYFTGEIQSLTTQSQERLLETIRPVTALETQLNTALSPGYHRWITDRDQHIGNLASAPSRHLERLARIQHLCTRE